MIRANFRSIRRRFVVSLPSQQMVTFESVQGDTVTLSHSGSLTDNRGSRPGEWSATRRFDTDLLEQSGTAEQWPVGNDQEEQ
jgi:hypothetical protein